MLKRGRYAFIRTKKSNTISNTCTRICLQVEKRVALLPLAKACTSDYAQRKELQARLDGAGQECRDLDDELSRLKKVAIEAQPIAEQKDSEVAKVTEAERELYKVRFGISVAVVVGAADCLCAFVRVCVCRCLLFFL